VSSEIKCTNDTAWCPGCGNFGIIEALRDALNELGKKPNEVLIVGGIGQAAKTPQYFNTNGFCGLHGRSLPPAVAAKISNKDLTVVVNTGDGDSYGEGGNHFIHNVRRNVDIAHFVHDNQIYGLTKGQASPTTALGQVTSVQTMGNLNIPFSPLLIALASGAGFVARSFSGDKAHLKEMMKEAISYKGYALVDILQPCVTFNKVNTFMYYKKNTYKLDEGYDYTNRDLAVQKAMEWDNGIPVGIIYKQEMPDYIQKVDFLRDEVPLVDQKFNLDLIKSFTKDFS
jgi:2-oxoglutarate/2-oxoacid ferredoxin oxidoreductase subunit beta